MTTPPKTQRQGGTQRACPSPFERAHAYVAEIPGAVQGNHGDCQTLAVTNVLVWDFALSPSEALTILREYNTRCAPPWTDAELIRKIQSAERQSHYKPRGNLLDSTVCVSRVRADLSFAAYKGTPDVRIDPATATENFVKGIRCDEVDLWEASPIRPPDDWTNDGALLVAMLHAQSDNVNVVVNYRVGTNGKARPAGVGVTLPRDEMIRQLQKGEFSSEAGGWLRMNPLDGRGVADTNVTAHRFALIECAGLPLELQLPLLAKLPLPIAVIINSGGRSLHAWVSVRAENLEDYRRTVARMLVLLAKFGVDGKNKNPSRISRLPGVVRRIGAAGDGRQRLLYVNPEPQQKAIL